MIAGNKEVSFLLDGVGTVGYLYTKRATADNIVVNVVPQVMRHDRSLDIDGEGNVWGVEFFFPMEVINAELDGKPKPEIPDVDLRGLSRYPSLPSEGVLTLELNEKGLVPLVSHDLIPE